MGGVSRGVGGWTTPRFLQACVLSLPGPPRVGAAEGLRCSGDPATLTSAGGRGETAAGASPGAGSTLDPLPTCLLRSCSSRFSPVLSPSLIPLSVLGCPQTPPLHSPARPSPPSSIYLCISFPGNHQFPSVKQRRLPII